MRVHLSLSNLHVPRSLPAVGGVLLFVSLIPCGFGQSASAAIESPTATSSSGEFSQGPVNGELGTSESVEKIRARAEEGSARDQFRMGYAYSKGIGAPHDDAEAL